MNSNQLRGEYIRFFEEKGHKALPSSSLIPQGDPTLLLTNAGMVQFKPYFMGEGIPPSRRLVSCQKCFRTTDIESVGNIRHLIFFEMLGNFSIGDYFKREAIAYAWEFVTQRLGLPLDRLWITLFLDDDESFRYWRELGIPEGRIVRYGEENNFWGPAGDSGPCGPSTEIHYDLGEEFGCGKPTCAPGCDCDRFLELWNIVFTQYYQDRDGNRSPLPQRNVDTGMGLERVAAVLQGKGSFYDTDLFSPLIGRICELASVRYGEDKEKDRAIRIVAEHSRALAFLIADGVLPSNEGRGYVLRRVLRRAARFGRKLGLEQPFISNLAELIIEQMGELYPELIENRVNILRTIQFEEEGFNQTLDTGLGILRGLINYRVRHGGTIPEVISFAKAYMPSSENASSILEQYGFVGYDPTAEPLEQRGERLAAQAVSDLFYQALKNQEEDSLAEAEVKFYRFQEWAHKVSGEEAFLLYDTYGFPVELTAEIAAENGLSIDLEGFEQEMASQRKRARAARKKITPEKGFVPVKGEKSEFVGYENLRLKAQVGALVRGGKTQQRVGKGQEVEVVLNKTPFYAEMGGQVGDSGEIKAHQGRVAVAKAIRPPYNPNLISHQGQVVEGTISVGDEIEAEVNAERRLDISRNHTATHLLHAALRCILGSQVRQMGSSVAPERLRFDFSHHSPLSQEELEGIQRLINEWVRQDLIVEAEKMPYEQAVASGALALFGEKYGDIVRVVKIKSSDEVISAELCGGTHTGRTGEIGICLLVSEGSIGAGLRRIEAVTGRGAEEFIRERVSSLEAMAQQLQSQLDEERRRAAALGQKLAKREAESLLPQVQSVNGVSVLAAEVVASDMDTLRQMGDWLKERLGSGVVVLGAIWEDKPHFVAMVTPDLVKRGLSADEMAKQVAKVAGGGGGGRPHLGQAGGKDKTKLGEALHLVGRLVKDAHLGT
jgi:alanyl-tRNA synthetase